MYSKEKLGKIVQLAKRGIGGEKEAALRMVKRICKTQGLDFDSVMNDINIQEFELKITSRNNHKLILQIIARFGLINADHTDIYSSRDKKRIWFQTTKEKYIEVVNAATILCRLYQKEKKKIQEAAYIGFLHKHELFPQFELKQRDRKMTDREREIAKVGMKLAEDMENAKIYKQLK